jgi:hypothetical protein
VARRRANASARRDLLSLVAFLMGAMLTLAVPAIIVIYVLGSPLDASLLRGALRQADDPRGPLSLHAAWL